MSGPLPIYLDHNATTPVDPRVREAMLPWLTDRFGNPSSAHAYGREAAKALALARAQVADAIGATPDEIVFTGGGTEADNLALLGARMPRPRIVTSAVEHPAVEHPAGVLADRGVEWERLRVDRNCRVDLEHAAHVLEAPTGMLSVILAQNEVGVLQPVAELSALARAADSKTVVHSDAAQAVGKVAVDVDALGVDLLTIVSHKLYGPCGVGALYVRARTELAPLLGGGGQERGLRPGTEPLALLVGFGEACRVAVMDLAAESARQTALRDALWERLERGVPGLLRSGGTADMLPNTLHVCFPDRDGADILARAPEVAASTGSACHADGHTVSGTLGAMGLAVAQARGAVRLSLGRGTTAGDIEAAAAAIIHAFERSAPCAPSAQTHVP